MWKVEWSQNSGDGDAPPLSPAHQLLLSARDDTRVTLWEGHPDRRPQCLEVAPKPISRDDNLCLVLGR